jgi:uncharacterized OsmC-like protein
MALIQQSEEAMTDQDLHRVKEGFTRAIRTVTLKPGRGQRCYTNTASVASGTLCTVREGTYLSTFDVGKGMGGSGEGPSPSVVLRSAITSCVAIGIKLWAAQSGLSLREIRVTLETDVDARGQLGVARDVPPGFTQIRLAITIVSYERREAIENIITHALKMSPLMDVMQNPQSIDLDLSIAAPSKLDVGGENG